ncbi:MAG: heavy metal translocating P-type ATPase metal-binding domain-containing protein [Methylococcales bacterium]|nr:heavy metal translocating P-type ATPase metal-binding domain-containing protein [Methylococcales bacterium]
MKDKKVICDLCGLIVETNSFKLKTKDGDKQFCCEGCKGIFQMLHEDQILSEPVNKPNN